jgi:hypothetical protein
MPHESTSHILSFIAGRGMITSIGCRVDCSTDARLSASEASDQLGANQTHGIFGIDLPSQSLPFAVGPLRMLAAGNLFF